MVVRLDRRQFTQTMGAGLAATAWGLGPVRAADKTITVLNWQGYGTDEKFAVKKFQEMTGYEVKHDYYNAEPEMLTKLRTNPGAYDVAILNTARDSQAQAENLIDAIDLTKVPNAAGLADTFKTHPNITIDGKTYGVPWVWGMNALAVRRDKVTGVDSYNVFTDPAYVGRCALFDDAVTGIAMAALLTGQNINNPADMKKIGDTLKTFKKNVKLLWSSEDEWNKAFGGGAFDISVYWSGAVARSQKLHNLAVDFLIPKEGAIGWLDNLCLPATSTKKEQGLAFINYMIDPKFYVDWVTGSGAPASANSAAMNELPATDLNRQIHKPEYLSKIQFMGTLPDDRRQAYNDLWEEVKAYYAHS
ncbi:ABC transporter substrate-binding protein [Lichenifustis flavocetrariae]|uniref:Extracellular solute-binding protein n=1 Tax=Lichenifustis flavocetrariae TaxID=2949735 RepID=A0AA41Z425_9HYPH|nr:extracellular solute-binding protein [Lichenifustis flavocetrariae]MCW6509955.1 extracellular solute-binding protein [Lichenifustis flavocetrariae]